MEKLKLIETIQSIHYTITRYVESELRKTIHKPIMYSHYEILRLLHVNKKMSLKELAQRVLKHKSTITALAKKLEHYDYIYMEKDKRDERRTFVF